MKKRKQIIYLAIATLLICAMYFLNMAVIPGKEEVTIRYYENPMSLALLILATLGHICSLASMKIPILQARMCSLTAIVTLGFQILLIIYFIRFREIATFSISALFPTAAAFMTFLAGHASMVDVVTAKTAKSILRQRK